jgi:hypothetical protein
LFRVIHGKAERKAAIGEGGGGRIAVREERDGDVSDSNARGLRID